MDWQTTVHDYRYEIGKLDSILVLTLAHNILVREIYLFATETIIFT
jgi:hypothetical protein